MSKLLIAFALAVTACGGSKSPPPTEPAPTTTPGPVDGTGEPQTPEECVAKGGEVRGDIGDGKVACAEGEQDLGRVRQGIEGAVCCAKPAAN